MTRLPPFLHSYLGTLSATESKILQVRLDTTNILNHPGIANPMLDISGSNGFGRGGSRREFKGSVRLNSQSFSLAVDFPALRSTYS